MKTYKTYQEAKMVNPEDDIFVSMCSEFATSEHVSYVSMCGTGEGWNKCNPADYCMSVYDFLSSGKRLVDGDFYLETTGKVAQVGKLYKAELVNDPCHNDKNRYILRAKALEEKEVEYEYIKVTDSIFDLRPDFEAGELYAYTTDYDDNGNLYNERHLRVESEKELLINYIHENIYRRTIKKPDWRDEVVCTGLADAKAEYLTLNCNLKIDEAEYLAKAILSGIEKARG